MLCTCPKITASSLNTKPFSLRFAAVYTCSSNRFDPHSLLEPAPFSSSGRTQPRTPRAAVARGAPATARRFRSDARRQQAEVDVLTLGVACLSAASWTAVFTATAGKGCRKGGKGVFFQARTHTNTIPACFRAVREGARRA